MRPLRAAVFAVLLGACTASAPPPPAASPSASGATAVVIGGSTKSEIQATLDAQYAAMEKRDLTAFQRTIDTTRGSLRRCETELFDVAGRTGVRPTPQVARVEAYGIYVRAWVDEGGDRGVVRWYYRQIDGRWVRSEPTSSEVGDEKQTTVDGIDIDYWSIDEDILPAIREGTRMARDTVVRNQLGEAKRPFGIRFYPTRSVQGIQDCSVVGFHLPNRPDDKFIRFFRYWLTPDGRALSPTTITFIQHEGLHWAQDQFITGISARLDWWLVEGWPDFIGESRSASYKRSVICGTPTPTYKQLADGPRSDLPDTKPEDAVRFYAFANTMIEYLYAQFGNSAYRDLLLAYKELADPNANLPKVLKVTPEQFHSGWIAFARKKYC